MPRCPSCGNMPLPQKRIAGGHCGGGDILIASLFDGSMGLVAVAAVAVVVVETRAVPEAEKLQQIVGRQQTCIVAVVLMSGDSHDEAIITFVHGDLSSNDCNTTFIFRFRIIMEWKNPTKTLSSDSRE